MLKKPNQQAHKTDKEEPSSDNTGNRVRNYAKYSGMAFQMGIIILIGTFIGKKLDAYFQTERPYLTIFLALLSIFTALYVTLKDLIKKD